MKNNWPETLEELLEQCEKLSNAYDLYNLGEVGEPFHGESEPRVDGTDYLAGEYQYGVGMIPAQWVTHVFENSGTCTLEINTSMKTDKGLKPCPFCGGEAKYCHVDGIRHPWSRVVIDSMAVTVCCTECGASIPSAMTQELVTDAWNRRAE